MSALPLAVWEDHLMPLLTWKDAARLGCTCRALSDVVREHYKDVSGIDLEQLQGALTTFPRARTVELVSPMYDLEDIDVEALVHWLREGGRGRNLENVRFDLYLDDVLQKLLQGGALPSLKNLVVVLDDETHRASLTEGFAAAMHELQLDIYCEGDDADVEPQLAALGLVRQLPALTKLQLDVYGGDDNVMQWPPFIPPTLKTLRIQFYVDNRPVTASLLRTLPDMLAEAKLERLEIIFSGDDLEIICEGLVHVAQALHSCSPTLKEFYIGKMGSSFLDTSDEETPDQVERLRLQWADVMPAAMSAYRELEVLVLPRIEVEHLFPPGTAFDRLTHLEISDTFPRNHPLDAGVMGLWETMASGGLPALAKLSVRFEGEWGTVEDVRTRLVPAFEAVAGTLRYLYLEKHQAYAWLSDEVDVGYELGAAIGKLRRLKDLALNLSRDGRFYHAVAEGLPASGGCSPLPLLWQVLLPGGVKTNADLVVSLLLPSVRVFSSWWYSDKRVPLLLACALRQAGYKHTWATRHVPAHKEHEVGEAVLSVIEPCNIFAVRSLEPPWAILPRGGFPRDW
jgi:hypothetical protein